MAFPSRSNVYYRDSQDDRDEDDEEMQKSESRRERLVNVLVQEIDYGFVQSMEAVGVLWGLLPDLVSRHLEHLHFGRLFLIAIFSQLNEGEGGGCSQEGRMAPLTRVFQAVFSGPSREGL